MCAVHHHHRASRRGSFTHAVRYDRIANRIARRLYARAAADVAAAGLPEGSRVLDAGTGPGRVPLAIAETSPGLRVDGLDQSDNMIEYARQRASAAGLEERATFVVGDVAEMPYPDGTFDLVISTASLHHWADVPAGIREVGRVLRPGGRVWIYDFRLALRRAEVAARTAFPGYAVRREPVRTSRLPVRTIGRLVIDQG